MDVPPEDPQMLAYETWQSDPTPENLHTVVSTLQPTIDFAVNQSGGSGDPLLKNKAKVFAADAVRTWDPAKGGSLKTWTGQQLMRLRRFRREHGQATKVSDRQVLDAYHLHRAEQEFMDQFDRDPDLHELADRTGLSPKKIAQIRNRNRATVSEHTAEAAGVKPETNPDYADEALEYVYLDADYVDRKILEMRLGYGGAHTQPVAANEVARKLKIHPSQVSRRAARLAYRIRQMEAELEKV